MANMRDFGNPEGTVGSRGFQLPSVGIVVIGVVVFAALGVYLVYIGLRDAAEAAPMAAAAARPKDAGKALKAQKREIENEQQQRKAQRKANKRGGGGGEGGGARSGGETSAGEEQAADVDAAPAPDVAKMN